MTNILSAILYNYHIANKIIVSGGLPTIMNQHTNSLHADITATVSCCMTAASRRDVLESAYVRLNEMNIRLLKVKMVNEQGDVQWFQVEKVHAVEWTGVEWMGYSNKFQVIGQVRLTVQTKEEPNQEGPGLQQNAYKLPRSAVNDLPHWAVPTYVGPALLCVRSHEIEWKTAASGVVYSKVG